MHIMNLKQSINHGLVVNLNMPEGDGGGGGGGGQINPHGGF